MNEPPDFSDGSLNIRRRLFLLVSIHSELFLSLMSCDLMLLSFLSARHSDAPYSIWILM